MCGEQRAEGTGGMGEGGEECHERRNAARTERKEREAGRHWDSNLRDAAFQMKAHTCRGAQVIRRTIHFLCAASFQNKSSGKDFIVKKKKGKLIKNNYFYFFILSVGFDFKLNSQTFRIK